jgi:hypothetical protein
MYTNVIFQAKTNASKLKVFVEKNELKFNDQGIATLALVEGQEYHLYCFASGKPGSYYELSIIEPKNIPLHISKTIDRSNEDKGKYSFTLSFQEAYSVYIS